MSARRITVVLVAAAATLTACSSNTRDGTPDPGTSVPPAAAGTDASSVPTSEPTLGDAFTGTVSSIDDVTAARMRSSWRPGCPVPLQDLRLLAIRHWGFDGRPRAGELVVHAAAADAVLDVFRALFTARFPIEQVRLVDEFGGDDDRSMAANNTSAFNCRRATGSQRWSEHAYGRAVDLNPVQNPFVTRNGAVLPPQGADHVRRDPATRGLITADGPVVAAFRAVRWAWGGHWSSGKDYQHFSASGR